MSSISWGTVKSLLIFFGPMLLPKAIAYYRSVRAVSSIQGIPNRPPHPKVIRALVLLSLASLSFLFKSLPLFSPENIFRLTSSRLQIATDVLFIRLLTLRPNGFTPRDEILRRKITSNESRLYYFQYGPDVMADCQWCSTEDPNSYFYYTLPALLVPHLFNICVLALATSRIFTGKEGTVWRTTSAVTSMIMCVLDLYLVSSYQTQTNSRATRLEDIDTFFWRMRICRALALAALDGVIGWLLYLSSTNRAFVTPLNAADRVENVTRTVETLRKRMNALGIIRNTVSRDEGLRSRSHGYWIHEGKFMGELMEEREVVEGVRNALASRINMTSITTDAEAYAHSVVGPLQDVTETDSAT